MTRFRHDLILRMIKLLDAVLVTIPFAMIFSITHRCVNFIRASCCSI